MNTHAVPQGVDWPSPILLSEIPEPVECVPKCETVLFHAFFVPLPQPLGLPEAVPTGLTLWGLCQGQHSKACNNVRS